MQSVTDYSEHLATITPTGLTGNIVQTDGVTASVAGFPAPFGAICDIEKPNGQKVRGEVVGFRDDLTVVYPFADLAGVRRGCRVQLVRSSRMIRIGESLIGRVVNAHVQTIDDRPQPFLPARTALDRQPPPAIERVAIDQPISTGVRAIDAMLTCGCGQRMGIYSGSAVGKSTLLGMMARQTTADVIVVGLIGERGREVSEFILRDLGERGMQRSVVVVSTSDEPALMRIRAAESATAIAEFFRDQGKNVLLLMDSLTRYAMAQREIGLARGETPATRGYPPSVFSQMPKLLERCGRTKKGSITAFYTVLVEGDDLNEPVSDALRGLLDGHVVLSRELASRGHFPAIDILESVSRLQPDLVDREHSEAVFTIRKLLAALRDNRDLISIGAYRHGSMPALDVGIDLEDEIQKLLVQRVDESGRFNDSRQLLASLAEVAREKLAQSE